MDRYFYVTEAYYTDIKLSCIVKVITTFNSEQFRGEVIKDFGRSVVNMEGTRFSFCVAENIELDSRICELLYG